MSLIKMIKEIKHNDIFNDVNFDELDKRFYNNRFSKTDNKERWKSFKAKDGKEYIIGSFINERDTFRVYTKEFDKVGLITIDEKNEYITGYKFNDSIYVEPKYRRKGIAHFMIKYVEYIYSKPYKPTETARENFLKVLKNK